MDGRPSSLDFDRSFSPLPAGIGSRYGPFRERLASVSKRAAIHIRWPMVFEVFVLNLIGLALGLVALRYDRDIADALTYFPYWIGELIRQRYLGWRPRIPPPSRERFETWLKFIRFWAWFMIVVGFFNFVTFLIVGVWS